MKKWWGKTLLGIFGWKVEGAVPNDLKRMVMVAAPHTSNWDYPIAIVAFMVIGIRMRYFIKDSYTKPPLGFIFKGLGAIGVNRSRRGNLTQFAVELLNESSEMVILVPAEGTRGKVEKWKTGFYHIAVEAEVPIVLGYVNYKNKIAGIGPVYYPTGDFQTDMDHIQKFYEDKVGRFPDQYNPKIY